MAERVRNARASIAPARLCAYRVVRRVFEQQAWADRALTAEIERLELDGRDRALARQLAFGTVQRLRTLDYVLARFIKRELRQVQPAVLAILRLGVFQLVYLDRVPAHAVVDQAVQLAKQESPKAASFVNAVLRRSAQQARVLVEKLTDETPEQAALCHSYPDWIVELWWRVFGPETARALLAAGNQPAQTALRANTLKLTAAELRTALAPIQSDLDEYLPEAVVIEGQFDAHGSELFREGAFMPQSRAAMTVSHCLNPQPGERVLDLCAAPGGKTTHLAALMRNKGEIVAIERNPKRAAELQRTVDRMGTAIVGVKLGDARVCDEPEAFDRVLVDPPCSDLGTLSGRPDVRWHKQADDPQRLAAIQGEILRAGLAAVKPGGTLVYSTCTLSPSENEDVILRAVENQTDFQLVDLSRERILWQHPSYQQFLLTMAHRDDTDGFFIACLKRKG